MPPVGVRVSLDTEMQKFLSEKTVTPSSGQNPRMTADSAQVSAASVTWTRAAPDTLMARVLAPANLRRACQRVVSNKGAPGADGMTVDQLADYVKQYWPILKARLLAGEYHPQGVRAVDIPKPKGGTRQLGIPSVVDRLIQQALLQQFTPQGGPLSPLLSNILLNELDRELERRGHRFVRYADDANIYVRSRRAGERVMASVERFLSQRLKLTLNREKSRVAGSWMCDYLGYGMSWHQQPRLRVATMSLRRLRDRLGEHLRGARGRKLVYTIERINPVLRGWAGYFKLTQGKRVLERLDGWVRHKLRCALWRQWKRPSARARNLMRLGIDEQRAYHSAFNGRGPWWNSGAAHMNQALPKKIWDGLGLVSILDTISRLNRII
ncbi:group II intron maturase-specific domain-containing protein [Pseudomonas sp. RA_35y_Pfl2_P32]|uniref:group II intron maturase-specific domain-containing protein n=1 Tax=Pseudomonas sp. RA_35y_Pfl2_P32 TaxID=3088705 RepID=UPI0030DDC8C7